MTTLDPALAARFARITLAHVGQSYPFRLDQILTGPADVVEPATLHPIFHGSFDWHSCVHGWWQLLTIARLHPTLPEAEAIRARADAMLTPGLVAGERAYLDRPLTAGFERPYGWAWALALHAEAARHDAPWGEALAPLAADFAARFATYLPKLTYPVRAGTHANTAFAGWFAAFLPDLALGRPETLFTPAHVSDRSDGKIAHLDGLNLSRAWCWRSIAAALGPDHATVATMADAADRHLAASLPHLDDDYMGGHWLATFALLATT